MLSLLRGQTNKFMNSILYLRISLSFLLIWYWNDKYIHTRPVIPQKPYPIPDQNGQSVYPFSDKNGTKTLSDGVAHTYIAYTREYPRGEIATLGAGVRVKKEGPTP